ncbi:hypothetical protein RHSIM_Rhsim11G0193500 [Rhododendron simsii]|uniref:Vps72/YL1 C-terminal domain-containing protein n=1 Tax=Rhododendron simsii TaxID=118357 RepID=A0A834LBL4_RHOSS|nr:hypothetical protein RHSIM_Rhsim11G0193500 [Rhododendron simsii]
MDQEIIEAELVLPTHLCFKKVQMYEKYPKGQQRGRWKHLKQIIQAENYQNYPPDEPNCWLCLKKALFVGKLAWTMDVEYADRGTLLGIWLSLRSGDGVFFILFADVNIESPPSMHPCKRICDITGFEAPYVDPRTNLRYANTDVFKLVRSLPNEYVQRYLALRNAAVVLK